MDFEYLKTALSFVMTITTIALGIITVIIKKKSKKELQKKDNRIIEQTKYIDLKYEGVEELTRKEMNLREEKIKEQLRVVKEISDTFYYNLLFIYIKWFNIKINSMKYKAIENDLAIGRKLTDIKFKEVIYNNNIASRNDRDWIGYVSEKKQYIFSEVEKLLFSLQDKEVYSFANESDYLEFKNKVIALSYAGMDEIFHNIRCISIEFAKEIQQTNELLKKMKQSNR